MSYVSSVSSDVTAYDPVTTSGSVNFTGLGNGTDFNDIIDAEIEVESYQKENYEAQLSETESCITLLEGLSTSMSELDDALDELNSVNELLAMETTASEDDVTVKVTGEAQEGSHNIVVNQLAQNSVFVKNGTGYAETTNVVSATAGTFVYSCNGEEFSIDVPAQTTAENLVTLINTNADSSELVEADLLFDGAEYHFRISGKKTGADYAVAVSDTTTLPGFASTDMEQVREAQNAEFKVDGYPSGADVWLERDTNTADDVVTGLELTLTDVTEPTGITLSISCDEETTKENITNLVENMNTAIYEIQKLSGRITTYVEDDDGEQVEAYTIDSYSMDIMYNDLKKSAFNVCPRV